jgi:2,4-dienoyl-CoA reductase-like NADH-dependent reductase (Old Yellow Enzyme family)
MAVYCAREGVLSDWHFAHYAKFAMGGAGFVCMEATKVERRGLGTVGDQGLWSDTHVPRIRAIADFIHSQDSKAGIQLNHAGRKAGTLKPADGFGPMDRSVEVEGGHWEVIGPSAVPYLEGWPVPREMTIRDIEEVIEAFGQAARRAHAANIDVIEIHGAHGYLIHQFLSPSSNLRTDKYGGSLPNRMRFALQITEHIREIWPAEKALFFRISAQDDTGWGLEESFTLSRELAARGVDVIDCSSSGTNVRSAATNAASLQLGFQVPFAEAIRRETGIPTIAVGLIVQPQQADSIIKNGQADLVAIGRELLYNPFWPHHAAMTLGVDPEFKNMPPQIGWWLNKRAKSGYRA